MAILFEDLTLNFQGQIFDYYISGKNGLIASKIKSTVIYWMWGIKFGHQFLFWPWPWTLIFEVKY